jgi:uncharacterized protein YndB with AHSA1/START domain
MSVTTSDRIEKKVLLRAPRARVWKALTDEREFGHWFGVRFDGPFKAGTTLRGVIVPTGVDAEIAKRQEPYAGTVFEISVDRIEPERLFSFRWHPGPVEPGGGDYSNSDEPTTLVVFRLEDAEGGILLTVTESGFDHVPLARRAKAFEANDTGWAEQMKLIEKYIGQSA